MIPAKQPYKSHGRRHDDADLDNPRKLFVGGVSRDTIQNEFHDYFSQFGEVEDVVLMIDHITQKNRGFGFVVFAHQQTVDDVLSRSSQNSLVLRGRTLDCKKAIPRSKQNPNFNKSHQRSYQPQQPHHQQRGGGNPYYSSTVAPIPQQQHQNSNHYNGQFRKTRSKYANKANKIFVGGFSEEFTDQTLHDHFSKYGLVSDAMVMIDKEGNSRKFGFVTMQNSADADAAVFDGDREIDGVHVTVQRAIPKDEMADGPRRPTRSAPQQSMYGQPQQQPHAYPMHANVYGLPPQAPAPIYPQNGYPQYAPHPQLQYAHLPPTGTVSSYPQYSAYPNQATSSYPQYAYAAPQLQLQPQPQVQSVQSNADPRNVTASAKVNDDVKKEATDKQQTQQAKTATTATATATTAPQTQMYGAPPPSTTQIVPRYNDKGIYVAPPVHAPAQYGTYHDVKTSAGQYGATRGQVAATRAYAPY